MQAYSLDLRQRVVRAYEQGQRTVLEIAEQFSVSTGFVKKMLRQWRETDDLSPRPHGGGPRLFGVGVDELGDAVDQRV